MAPEQTLTVVIHSPRGLKKMPFAKTAKIEQVINEARAAFGFEPGTFVLKRQSTGEVLSPPRTLVSYRIEDDEVLELIPEMGSGV